MPRTAQILAPTARNLRALGRVLRKGGLVAAPTETVYGLAADATNARACRAVFKAKGRPSSDPLIVHVASLRQLSQVAHTHPAALALARRFWPGPLTLVLPKTTLVPDAATAGLPSVAVRMPAHRDFLRLIRAAGVPLAAPSANPFGYVSPTTALHVQEGLGARIGFILDGGPCPIGVESTIVDLRDPDHPVLLRPGAVTRSQLAAALRRPVALGARLARRGAQVAPGQLARHYSPRTRIVLHRRLSLAAATRGRADEAFLFVAKPGAVPHDRVFWLDAKGSARGAARRLFAVLRNLDARGFRRIHAELPRSGGIADALIDRLVRAAAR